MSSMLSGRYYTVKMIAVLSERIFLFFWLQLSKISTQTGLNKSNVLAHIAKKTY